MAATALGLQDSAHEREKVRRPNHLSALGSSHLVS